MIDVVYMDGTKSRFSLKQLTIRQLYEFCYNFADGKGPELVALCTGQPIEVIDRLSSESFSELHGAAFTENFSKATPIIQRDPALAAKMIPAIANMQSFLKRALTDLSLKESPAPAPSESKVDAGSESSTSPQPA